MQAREALMVQDDPAHEGAAAGDEVDDPVGKPRLLVDLHQVVVGEHRGGGRLPHHRVAHEGRGSGQVRADGGEVEGRDGEDEALQGPVVDPVPGVHRGVGLVLVDLLHEGDVVAEEVRGLASGVDLSLVGVLGLVQHGGRVEPIAVAVRDEAGDLVEDGRPVLPGGGLPGLLGLQGRIDGQADLRLPGLVVVAEHVLVLVGADHPLGLPGADLLAADDEGDLELRGVLPLQLGLQQSPLRGSRGIGLDRLVVGGGDLEEGVGHGWLQRGEARPRFGAAGRGQADAPMEKL